MKLIWLLGHANYHQNNEYKQNSVSEVTSALTLNLVAYTNVQQNGKYPEKHLS